MKRRHLGSCECVCFVISSEPSTSHTAPRRCFFFLSEPESSAQGPETGSSGCWIFGKKLNKINKGWTLAAKLPGRSAGRGERDGAIDGAEESDEWKGQDGTAQPRCWGRYFWTARQGRSARLSASALPRPRRRPASLKVTARTSTADRKGEGGRKGEGVERSQEAGRHAAVPGLK